MVTLLDTAKMTEYELFELAHKKQNFRIRQAFICSVCGSRTNLAQRYEYGIRVWCPNSAEKWHNTLQQKLQRLNESGHPEYYVEALKKEVKVIKKDHLPKSNVKGKVNSSEKMRSWDSTTVYYFYRDIW